MISTTLSLGSVRLFAEVWLFLSGHVTQKLEVCVCVYVESEEEEEEEEELFEDVEEGEDDASDENKEECEVHIENEDDEARRRSPASLNSEAYFCMTMEVMQRNQRLHPSTTPNVSFAFFCNVFPFHQNPVDLILFPGCFIF